MTPMERFAPLYARIALGSALLSAVAARFGLWRDRGPHPFAQFISYTAEVNSFLPPSFAPFLAVAATIAETMLGIALIAGIKPRWTGVASAILLALFGTAMSISGGIKSALDASVFSASAAALLLAHANCTSERSADVSSAQEDLSNGHEGKTQRLP
jgi:putative oxidoreductase